MSSSGEKPLTQQQFEWDSPKPERLLRVDEIFEVADEGLLRRLGEDNRIERKPSSYRGSPLGEYVCMWANTRDEGGLIVIGQHDKKNGLGFEGCDRLPDESLNKIEKVAGTFCPDGKVQVRRVQVTNDKGEDDFVLLLRVRYNPDVVVRTTSGKVFHRVADEKKELKTPEEIRELQGDKGEVRFELQDVDLSYPDDFNEPEVHKFIERVRTARGLSAELKTSEILEIRRLGRIVEGRLIPNQACALLFAKDPIRMVPGCMVHVLRFDGEFEKTGDQLNTVKDERLEGTIPELIAQTERWLESQLRVFSPQDSKTGKFFPVPEYPKLAWYEAVVNACGHRSYGNGLKNMTIFVKMFDDHLVVESPGGFPPFVTPENIFESHVPRNPALMDALFYMDYDVKCAHEGTRKIRDQMERSQLPSPEFSQKTSKAEHLCVRVTLRNNIKQRRAWIDHDVSKVVSEAIAADLSENEKSILNWASVNGRITVSDANKNLDISWQSARRLLFGLAKKRVLQYIRFRPYAKDVRDPKAYFRLRRSEPLPDGGFEQSEFTHD